MFVGVAGHDDDEHPQPVGRHAPGRPRSPISSRREPRLSSSTSPCTVAICEGDDEEVQAVAGDRDLE